MEIIGIGIDFVEVRRIEEALTKHPTLAGKLFTESEIAFCQRRRNVYEALAARFASKEAMLKALAVGWRRGVKFTEMTIKKEPGGKPVMDIAGESKKSRTNSVCNKYY